MSSEVVVMNTTMQRLRRSFTSCCINSTHLSRKGNICLPGFEQACSAFD